MDRLKLRKAIESCGVKIIHWNQVGKRADLTVATNQEAVDAAQVMVVHFGLHDVCTLPVNGQFIVSGNEVKSKRGR